MSIFNFKSPQCPKALLLAVFIILASQMAIVHFDNELYTDLRNGVFAKVKSELSTLPHNNFDVLFMGDCYTQTGIDPRVFDHLTGLSSFNFSTDAFHTIMSSYIMLKNYLHTDNKKPQYIFIGFLPKVWTQTKESIIQNYLFVFSDYLKGNTTLLFGEFGLHTFKFFIPVLKHQDFLRTTSLSNLIYRVQSKKEIDRHIGDYVFKYKGIFLPIEWGDSVRIPNPPQECGNELRVSPFFKKYMEAMLELGKKDNIKIVYIIPSAPPIWEEHQQLCHSNKAVIDYLNHLKEVYPNLSVLDPQPIMEKTELYYNDLHLNTKGAEEFSRYLANVVKQ